MILKAREETNPNYVPPIHRDLNDRMVVGLPCLEFIEKPHSSVVPEPVSMIRESMAIFHKILDKAAGKENSNSMNASRWF